MILIRHIIRATAEHYALPLEAMTEPLARKNARPRQLAMYLSTRLTKHSSIRIGHLFRRDHSTVLWGVKAAEKRCIDDAATSAAAGEIAHRLLLEEAAL